MANAPSRLALKILIMTHKPDFIFIVERKLDFQNLPNNWFSRLGYKPFAFNCKDHPSLWCLCPDDLSPSVISASNQFVAFSFELDHSLLACTTIYASTNLINR